MAAPDPHSTGAQVDRLLERLRSSPDPDAAATAEDLVRSLVQLYGAGLARIADLLGPQHLATLCADALVESLLLVHDLHPVDRNTRIRRALDRTRPSLTPPPAGLDFLGVDAAGVVHVRLTGGGRGCGSAGTAERTIAAVVADAAPETSGVAVEIAPAPPPLLQISLRPGLGT